MKHYSKKLNVFLYICLALFAYSCSEENDFIKKKKIDFAIKEKSFKEALGMPLFTNAYSKLAQKTVTSTNTELARTALEEQFGFMIVPDAPVKIITKEDGTVFFTILIERDIKEDLKFENLIMKVFNEETSAAIFKYTLTEKGIITQTGDSSIKGIDNTVFTDLNIEGKMFFNSNGETCFDISVILCNVADWRDAGHIATATCFAWFNNPANPGYNLYIGASVACMNPDSGGGSESGSGNNPGGTSSNNHGGGGAGNGGNDPLITTPISCKTGNCIEADSIKTPCEEIKAYYLKPKPMEYSSNLDDSLNLTNESGFYANIRYSISAQAFVSNYAEIGIESCSNNQVIWPSIKSLYWLDHTHTLNGDAYLIPSFLDLYALYKIRRDFNVPNYTPNDNMFSVAMTVEGFKYVIKIENYEVLKNKLMGLTKDEILLLNSQLNLKMPDTPTTAEPDEMATKFLTFCENYGISLYRKATNEGWNKLKLNSSKTNIEEEPCTN